MPSAQSVLIKLACEARVPSNDRYHRKLTFNLGRVNDTLLDSATTGRSRPEYVVRRSGLKTAASTRACHSLRGEVRQRFAVKVIVRTARSRRWRIEDRWLL